jgi:hypothetical protein
VTTRRTEPGEPPPKRPPPRAGAGGESARPSSGQLKIARRYTIELPDGICLQCFNMQQQFRFPFLVYCEHKRMLAVVRSAHEYSTFQCAPNQLQAVIAKLAETGLESNEAPEAPTPEEPPKQSN